jgi:tRNA 2-thiouridine synthesizing protein D
MSLEFPNMKFAILINSAPFTYQACDTAYHFCQAALKQGHTIQRVFFYHDAVYTGSSLTCPPQDEANITARWQELANQYGFELALCVAAALKRGILDEQEAKRYGKSAANLANGFKIVGLGQLVEACLVAERCLVFGA